MDKYTNKGFLGVLPVDSATELGRSSTEIGEGAVALVPLEPLGGLGDVPRPPLPFFTDTGSLVSTERGGVATFSVSSGSFFSSFSTFLCLRLQFIKFKLKLSIQNVSCNPELNSGAVKVNKKRWEEGNINYEIYKIN